MNDNHSNREFNYRPRWLAPLLRQSIQDHSIVVLTGARQVGKSTLLQYELPFSEWRYLSLDDFDVLAQSKDDPSSLWAGTDRIVIDEVQKSPHILDAVKTAVDSHQKTLRFVLTGSANLLLFRKVSESLAGRAIYFVLQPMTYGEASHYSASNFIERLFSDKSFDEGSMDSVLTDPLPLMWKGFMPALLTLSSGDSVVRWWEGYVMTYLERDLRQLSQVDSLPDFRRLMTALALRCGQILNQSEVARDTSIPQPTVHRYINLLETTCLLERLPAYALNRTKRLIKSPKLIWTDPGLACFLTGHHGVDSLRSSKEKGGIFESMIYLHLSAMCQLMVPKPRLFYWRTSTGKEVDFVLEWGRKLVPVEVKLTDQPRYSDVKHLRLFQEEYPESSMGVLIHGGSEMRMLSERIVAVPWMVLGGGLG